MPNWRIAEDYEFTAKLSGNQWAWEFLRRNPSYQHDYEESLEPERLWREAGGGRLNEHAIYIPPRSGSETPIEWQRRNILDNAANTKHPYRPAIYYALHWPIAGVIKDPSDDTPPSFKPEKKYPRLLDYSDIDFLFAFPEKTHESPHQHGAIATVCLHLGRPYESQVEEIRAIYQAEVESREIKSGESARPDVTRWTNCLRILDAKAAHIAAQEICRVVWPEYYDNHTSNESDKEISRRYAKTKFLYSTEGIYAILRTFPNSD